MFFLVFVLCVCVCVPLGVVLNPPRHANNNNNLGIKRETLASLRFGAAPLKPLKADGTFPATGMKLGIFQLGKQLRISKDFGNPKRRGGSSCSKILVGISWSDGSPCLRWGLGDPRVPLYGQGDFWGVLHPHSPRRSESIPGSRAKPFPGKPLGSAAEERSRASFWLRNNFLFTSLFSHFSAASAPEMSLFTLSLSPFPRPKPARLSIPAAGKGRSPGSSATFNPRS